MIRNNLFWSWHIRREFIPNIAAFADCLKKRILPSFETVGQEAQQVENGAYARMAEFTNEDTDPADLAEAAFDKGLDFYMMIMDMAQGIRNMFAAGLYHLFEQQIIFFHRRELLNFGEDNNPSLFTLKEAAERLADHGILVEQFRSWRKVQELKVLANAVKHADGPSCEKLKKLRPDLFCHPEAREFGAPYLPGMNVFQPLTGEGIYVSDEAFNEYVEAVSGFWSELAEALECRAS